jgi:hypothetical protein
MAEAAPEVLSASDSSIQVTPLMERLKDHLILFMAIALTGMEYFFHFKQFLVLFFLIIAFFFLKKRKSLNKKALLIIGVFLMLELVQGSLYYFSLDTFLATVIRFFLAYMVVVLLGRSMISIYIQILYFFAVISLVIYPTIFIPGMADLYTNFVSKPFFPLFDTSHLSPNEPYMPNMILYNFNPTVMYPPEIRNSGPFWEPGAYSIFLLLVFILAIFTTISTAGIVALFVYLIGLVLFKGRLTGMKLVAFVLMSVIGVTLFFSLPFLYEKIVENVSLAPETTGSRFGSALADIYYISENPFIGYGRLTENIFGVNAAWSQEMHRNNGVTDVFVRLGLIVGFFYFFILFSSIHKFVKYNQQPTRMTTLVVLTILLIGFSQLVFNRIIFLSMIFLFIPFGQNEESPEHNPSLQSLS